MPLPTTYLTSTKNLAEFMNAIVSAQAPAKFTNGFLNQLEFTSSSDRLLVGLLKGIGFLDENGVPTQNYYNYLDQTQSGAVLADAIRVAYSDLFAINKKANELTAEDVKNKLRTLTQGQKSDDVLGKMANTFVALSALADWNTKSETIVPPAVVLPGTTASVDTRTGAIPEEQDKKLHRAQLHYNIQIHLPDSRDPAVYDAIFRMLREHLL